MQITKEQIKSLNPCQDGYEWYLKEGTEDLLETLLKVNKFKPDWASWLYTHLMSTNQNRRIAIFAAEQVLHVFETEYPDDKRPRLAIEAAKAVLLNDTKRNKGKARKAGRDSYAAAHITSHIAAYYVAYGAAYAAYAAAHVPAIDLAIDGSHTYPSAGDAYTAMDTWAPSPDGQIDSRELMIKEAVKILEEK